MLSKGKILFLKLCLGINISPGVFFFFLLYDQIKQLVILKREINKLLA